MQIKFAVVMPNLLNCLPIISSYSPKHCSNVSTGLGMSLAAEFVAGGSSVFSSKKSRETVVSIINM